MGVLRPPPSTHGSFHPVEEDVTCMAEASVHLTGVLREEAQTTEKGKGLKRLGIPQSSISSKHEVLDIWTDLQLSGLY